MSRRIRRLVKKLSHLKTYNTKKKRKGIDRSQNRGRYKRWRKSVYIRDNFQCQRCGKRRKLNAHHVKPWSLFPLDRYRLSNGITLCVECHEWVHREENSDNPFLDLGPYGRSN